jgi:hypothetical protein
MTQRRRSGSSHQRGRTSNYLAAADTTFLISKETPVCIVVADLDDVVVHGHLHSSTGGRCRRAPVSGLEALALSAMHLPVVSLVPRAAVPLRVAAAAPVLRS